MESCQVKVKVEDDLDSSTVDSAMETSENEMMKGLESEASDLITEDMLREEKLLHQKTIETENQMKQISRDEMGLETSESRYHRLQLLLNKSQMYSTYLLSRMERQRAEQQQRDKRLDNKRAKKEERLVKTATEKSEAAAEKDDTNSRLRVRNSQENNESKSPRGTKRKSSAGKTEEKNTKIEDFFKQPKKKRKVNKGENKEPVVESHYESQQSNQTSDNHTIIVDGKRMFKGEEVAKEQPKLFVGGILREYQVAGLKWLRGLYENGVNGILADEMGLGKTIQCISLVAYLVGQGVPGPFLICAPLSTVPNWVSEFKKFAPNIPVMLYHGSREERTVLRRIMLNLHTVQVGKREFKTQTVVITSYEITMNDRQYIMNYAWKLLIVDEGHRIKNFQCRLIQELKMYSSTHRLLLTGTPLQNNLSELWSLLNFLLPEIFDDLGSFEAWFDFHNIQFSSHEQLAQEENKKNILNMLHQILTPFMLRRLKSDIDLNIPPKREVLVYAPLTKKQAEMYRAVADKTIRNLMGCDQEEEEKKIEVNLDKNGRPIRKSRGVVSYGALLDSQNSQNEESESTMKKSSRKPLPKKRDRKKMKDNEEEPTEPDTAKNDDDDELDSWVAAVTKQQQIRESWGQSRSNSAKEPQGRVLNIQLRNAMALLRKTCNHPYLIEYPLNDQNEYRVDEDIVKVSGKFLILDRMLPELKKRGHKVLIFSQMTGILDVISDYCYLRGWRWCRLDGSMNLNDRGAQIDDFNEDSDIFIFLLSTRAGGLGINLTAADTCIIYDSDWNPQCDLQAQDRCHRIGQKKPVLVYRLVTANTIDQKIVERAAAKRKLEKMVIHRGQFKRGLELNAKPVSVLTTEELIALLGEIDYDEVVDHSVISDPDLERLLDRSDLLKKMEMNKELQHQESKSKEKRLEVKDEECKEVKGVFKVIDEDAGSCGSNKNALPCVNAEDTIIGQQLSTDTEQQKSQANNEQKIHDDDDDDEQSKQNDDKDSS